MLMSSQKSSPSSASSDICEKCTHKSCCSGYDSAILLPLEIKNIMKTTGMEESKFSRSVQHEGKFITVLKKKEDSYNCFFWDEKTKQCSIYANRPFDCQMFPFDVYYINKNFHWVIYSCNDLVDWGWTEDHLKKLESNSLFNTTMSNIMKYKHYSYLEIDESQDYEYTVIRKVKWNPKTSQ